MRKTSSVTGLLIMLLFVWVGLWGSVETARAAAAPNVVPLPASPINLTAFKSGPDFHNPIGIDFHEPNGGSVIVSVQWPTGEPNNLELINVTDGTVSTFSPGLHGLTDELKIATVRNSAACQQFPIGDVFTGNGEPGEIVRIRADGVLAYGQAPNNPGVNRVGAPFSSWVKLPGETKLLRGSLFVDRFCAFNGDLIVVTGDSGPTGNGPDEGGGHVWRINANGNATLLASITDPTTGFPVHLEGVITLPNDSRYGPWAGTIIAGDENFNSDLTKDGRVWSITAGGVVTPYTLAFTTGGGPNAVHHPVKPEDIDLIEPGGDFFGVNFGEQRILRAPSTDFNSFVPPCNQIAGQTCGDILITQEFPVPGTSGLYVVHWLNNNVVQITPLSTSLTITQWEHVTIAPRGDVQITKSTPNTSPINVGDVATYNIVVHANGPSPSFNVVVTDKVPAGVDALGWTIVTQNAPANACSPNPVAGGGTFTCNLGNLQFGGPDVIITLTAKTTAAACPSIQNTATVNSINDFNSSNNTSGPVTINLNCPPQLTVVKTPDNGTFTQGSQVSFNIVVSNPAPTGFSSATNVTLTDTLPTNGGLAWASVSSTQGACSLSGTNNSSLSCTLGTIAPQGSVTVTVTSTPTTPPAACQSQPNPAAIATADGGLKAQDSGSLTCTPGPQLAVVKTPDGGSFNFLGQASFTIVVSNPAPAGAQTATNVQLTDALPGNGGLVWQTATPTQGSCVNPIAGNSLSCSLGNIPAQGSVTVTVVSTTTTPPAACQSQPNPAAIATADGGLKAQDSGSLSCTPPGPQLAVVKTPDGGSFNFLGQATFTIVVSNPAPAGAQTATNVQLTDALPGNGGLVWQTATPTQGSCVNPIAGNSLSCSLGNIPAQGSVTVTVVSTTTTPPAACQSQPNPAAIATADGGLKAQDSGSLSCTPPGPQLAVVKTPDGGSFNFLGQATFTIVVSNPAPAGAQTATNVQLTDALPGNGGLVWQTATPTQGSCVNPIAGNSLSCSLGNIPAQGSVTVTVVSATTTPPAACQSQPNPAAIATADGGLKAQDSGSLSCTPPGPQLAVVKTPDGGSFNFLGQATFTIVVSNPAPAGAQTATNVQLTDALPGNGGLVWQTATPTQGSCVNPIAGNSLSCSLGNIPAQGSVTVTVVSTTTTPPAACQSQPNPAAIATADGGLKAQDSGSLTCTPPSKTIGIGPSSMEGAIRIDAGDFVNGGYSFKTNFTGNITIAATVSITGACLDANNKSLGTTDTITVPLDTLNGTVFAGGIPFAAVAGSDWKPTGNANSVLSWQGSIVAPPDLCGGNGAKLDASKGATFDASIFGAPAGGKVTFRFKFRDPAAKGKPNTNCLNTSDPNRNRADVCGASWSSTRTDP